MLAGQAEVAERFFKKSLSFLHSAGDNLKAGRGLDVANYYLGLSFNELLFYLESIGVTSFVAERKKMLDLSTKLRENPNLSQAEADQLSVGLIEEFVSICVNIGKDKQDRKAMTSIETELECLRNNSGESQGLVDTRFSVIFAEMGQLLENRGEALFSASD